MGTAGKAKTGLGATGLKNSRVPDNEPRLRVAQIWQGEVMDERTFLFTQDVSLGSHSECTFIIPELGLPPTFNLLRPSSRGYVLTIGEGMTGQLHLDGRAMTVTEFLNEHRDDRGSAGAFQAIPVKQGDWGVIHVDGVGAHTFFWQFVAPELPLPYPMGRDSELLLPAFLFAGILHAVILSLTWMYFDGPPNLVFSSGDALTSYLVRRPEQKPEEKIDEKKPDEPQPGVEKSEETLPPAAAAEKAGKVGGEGDKERIRVPEPGPTAPRDPIKEKVKNKGLLPSLRNSEKFAKVTSGFDGLGDKMSRLKGNTDGTAGSGGGTGSGTGDEANGTGTRTRGGTDGDGGGGDAHADIRTSEDIKTGGTRPPKGNPTGKGVAETKVTVDVGTPQGDFGDLTADQIYKVVNSRRRGIQACFEAQLQRNASLSGKVTITWRIKTDGTVEGARVKSSTMGNAAVESCLVRRVGEMKFPAPNSVAIVNFPFVFAPR